MRPKGIRPFAFRQCGLWGIVSIRFTAGTARALVFSSEASSFCSVPVMLMKSFDEARKLALEGYADLEYKLCLMFVAIYRTNGERNARDPVSSLATGA